MITLCNINLNICMYTVFGQAYFWFKRRKKLLIMKDLRSTDYFMHILLAFENLSVSSFFHPVAVCLAILL